MKSINLLVLLFFICSNLFAQKTEITTKTDTFSIYFEIDSFNLTQKESLKLQNFLSSDLILKKMMNIKISAYADYLGSNEYNNVLTENRAKTVKNMFNKTSNFAINESKAYGKIEGKCISEIKGNSKNRRVDIIYCYEIANKKIQKSPNVNETNQANGIDSLKLLKYGDVIIAKGLTFIGGRHFPSATGDIALKKLLKTLQDNSDICIEIQGHICCQSSQSDGLDYDTGLYNLSESRAKYVYDFLIENGISKERLSYKGFGATKKLYPKERNEDEQDKNRRVEIMITNKKASN